MGEARDTKATAESAVNVERLIQKMEADVMKAKELFGENYERSKPTSQREFIHEV